MIFVQCLHTTIRHPFFLQDEDYSFVIAAPFFSNLNLILLFRIWHLEPMRLRYRVKSMQTTEPIWHRVLKNPVSHSIQTEWAEQHQNKLIAWVVLLGTHTGVYRDQHWRTQPWTWTQSWRKLPKNLSAWIAKVPRWKGGRKRQCLSVFGLCNTWGKKKGDTWREYTKETAQKKMLNHLAVNKKLLMQQ